MEAELGKKIENIFRDNTYSKDIYYSVFKIFKDQGEEYSSNSSGVFININTCKQETLEIVYDYIKKIEKNNIDHEIYIQNTEKKIGDLKKSIKKNTYVEPKVKKQSNYNYSYKANNNAFYKNLDKELLHDKKVYTDVYKRIYNCMKGYKNKPEKKDFSDKKTDIDETDIHDDESIKEDFDIKDENDDEEDLFGDSSDEEELIVDDEEESKQDHDTDY